MQDQPASGKIVGYARVSKADQSLSQQGSVANFWLIGHGSFSMIGGKRS